MSGISEVSRETPLVMHRPKRRASFHGIVRWLHLYVSMIGFLAMLFFAITGITLNHPTWFGESTRTTTHSGTLEQAWVGAPKAAVVETSDAAASDASPDNSLEATIDKLAIVEHLRATHGLRGMVKEFLVDDEECSIAMNGPGYSADTIVSRGDGSYEVTVVEHGTIAVWNDLHKGRDTGMAWSWAIDLSALVMSISCITGLVMLMFMKRKRVSGTLWTAIGATIFIAVAMFLVK